jgi:hypothetical protein
MVTAVAAFEPLPTHIFAVVKDGRFAAEIVDDPLVTRPLASVTTET